MIYLSGPIGNGHTVDARTMYKNVRNGEDLMYHLMRKGWTVICPHLSYHAWINWEHDVKWDRWVQMDMDFVDACGSFFYMTPEEYGDSKGAKKELDEARRLNKWIYTNINEVPDIKE